jgi:hypothetical protein
MKEMIFEMIKSDTIQHSNSPFFTGLCVDYKAPNILIIKEKLLIPLIDKLLEELGATLFSKVDLWI